MENTSLENSKEGGILFKYQAKEIGDYWEEATSIKGLTCGETAQKIFDAFNEENPYGEIRHISKLEIISNKFDHRNKVKHTWQKKNVATKLRGKSLFDIMECSICGVEGKRRGLGHTVTTRNRKYCLKK